METFLEYETVCREPPCGHVFVGSLVEIDPRKVAEVVRGSRDIRSLQLLGDPIGYRIADNNCRSMYRWRRLHIFNGAERP